MLKLGIQTVSLAWFWGDTEPAPADQIYGILFSDDAQNIVRNKVPHPQTGLLSQAMGNTHGWSCVVQSATGRTDVYASSPDDNGKPTAWEAGVGFSALNSLIEAFAKSEVVKNPVRLVVVVRMFEPMPSAEAAGTALLPYLQIQAPLDRPLDLAFTVNQRMPVEGIEGVQMNRVLNINAGTVQEFAMPVLPGATGPGNPVMTVERHYANVWYDLNVVPTGRVFNHGEQTHIFTAMAAEIKRIFDAGSIGALA